jgi:plasmid stabilization system protein ParE
MSSRSIDIAPLADEDNLDIIAYSARMWGVARATEYVESLWAKVALLAEFPEQGAVVGPRYGGLRRLVVDQHVITTTDSTNPVSESSASFIKGCMYLRNS